MGTIPPPELLKQWQVSDLTAEMAIGHLIQNIVKLDERLTEMHKSARKLRIDVDSLIAHTNLPLPVKTVPQPTVVKRKRRAGASGGSAVDDDDMV